MKSLKQIINRYIRSAAIVMALVILVVIAFAEILIEQGRVEDTAAGTFVRLEQIIEENENELKQVKEKYDKTCLHDAEAIAFLLQKDPEAILYFAVFLELHCRFCVLKCASFSSPIKFS